MQQNLGKDIGPKNLIKGCVKCKMSMEKGKMRYSLVVLHNQVRLMNIHPMSSFVEDFLNALSYSLCCIMSFHPFIFTFNILFPSSIFDFRHIVFYYYFITILYKYVFIVLFITSIIHVQFIAWDIDILH